LARLAAADVMIRQTRAAVELARARAGVRNRSVASPPVE
jgi:hypothetical protein